MRKKILILTYYWPPEGGAGVQRWLKFVKYLSKEKYDITVYTPQNAESPNKDESLLEDVPLDIKVIKKPIWEPFEYYKKLTKKNGSFNAGFLNEEEVKKSSLLEKLSLFVRANFFIPDAKMFWIKPSVKFLTNFIQENNFELIISSGPPHSLHLIAQKLKKKTNIKWIADFRDPWTNIDFYKELPTLKITDFKQKKLEKKTIRQADQVIVVGNQMRKEFLEESPNAKITVLTNGFDSEINTSDSFFDKFTILHIGSINADRSHESFYKAIRLLIAEKPEFKDHFQLKFVGKVDLKARNLIRDNCLEEYCEFIPYKPYKELTGFQNKAHILYLPINDSPNAKGILTGKFYEYLPAQRYILAQGPSDGDLSKILQETNAGCIFNFKDVNNLKDKVEELFNDYLSGNYHYKSINIDSFSRQNITKDLEKIFKEIINQ